MQGVLWELGIGTWELACPFPPVSRQPEPKLFERRRYRIRGNLYVAHSPSHILPEPVRKRSTPLLIRAWIIERLTNPFRHFLKVRKQRLEMRPDIPDWAEVRQKHRVR